jgi:disulfide oxidoreductase YuzD
MNNKNSTDLSIEKINLLFKNMDLSKLKNIKSLLELEIRNKNPEIKTKIVNLFFDKITSEYLYQGQLSIEKILIKLIQFFQNEYNNLLEDNINNNEILNHFENNLKKHISTLTLTDNNNIPTQKYFKIEIKKTLIINQIFNICSSFSYKSNLDTFSILYYIIAIMKNEDDSILLKYIHNNNEERKNAYYINQRKRNIELLKKEYSDFFEKKYQFADIINENIEITLKDTLNKINNTIFFSPLFVIKPIQINKILPYIKNTKELVKEKKIQMNKNLEIEEFSIF